MATLESYQLTHPELLSENDLRDALRNCCIEISIYQDLCKSELIEIYKRIAMPLPQRKQQGSKESVEPKQNHQKCEKIGASGGDNQSSTSTSVRTSPDSSSCSSEGPLNNQNGSQNGRLKPPIDDCSLKKIKLSSASKTDAELNGINKRKNDENDKDSNDSPSKKRQKITWP